MKDYKLTVESFTVSWALGTFRGDKKDSFVSAAVKCDPPADLDDLPLLQARAALKVSASVIQDAVARQAISEDEARDRLKDIKENFAALEQAMINAREKKELESVGLTEA
jgi:hypothetical protein